MEELVEFGRAFVQAMQERRGIAHVDEVYAADVQSIEAVAPPGRDIRIAKGKSAIKAKRLDWIKTHKIVRLEVDGPYIHPPHRFGVRFEAEVIQKMTGQKKTLREIAVYTVENGEIVREEFFVMPN